MKPPLFLSLFLHFFPSHKNLRYGFRLAGACRVYYASFRQAAMARGLAAPGLMTKGLRPLYTNSLTPAGFALP